MSLSKLGMWDRFAIVLALVFSIGWPATIHLKQEFARQQTERDIAWDCIQRVQEKFGTGSQAHLDALKPCYDDAHETMKPNYSRLFFRDVPISVALCAILSAFVYGIIWTIASTVRWVLRGRTAI